MLSSDVPPFRMFAVITCDGAGANADVDGIESSGERVNDDRSTENPLTNHIQCCALLNPELYSRHLQSFPFPPPFMPHTHDYSPCSNLAFI